MAGRSCAKRLAQSYFVLPLSRRAAPSPPPSAHAPPRQSNRHSTAVGRRRKWRRGGTAILPPFDDITDIGARLPSVGLWRTAPRRACNLLVGPSGNYFSGLWAELGFISLTAPRRRAFLFTARARLPGAVHFRTAPRSGVEHLRTAPQQPAHGSPAPLSPRDWLYGYIQRF